MKEKISIIIPAYNEEKLLLNTLLDYFSYFKKNFHAFEMIVVTNNCSDSTPMLAARFALSRKNVKHIDFPAYTGKGGAVMAGIRESSGAIVCFVDADNSTRPAELAKLILETRNGFEVVIGSRATQGSVLVPSQPILRRLLGLMFSMITNLLFGLGIHDTQCGAKVFSRKAVNAILGQNIRKGFEFDVQLLWIAKKNNMSIKEKGISWSNNEESKVRLLDPLKMLVSLLALRFKGE